VGILKREALEKIGFRSLGVNVLLSDKASVYCAENIAIADNVRIDDFCILSGNGGSIAIGSHIHIASHVVLIGGGGIILEDFSTVSSHSSIYSASDDYGGDYLIGPIIDNDLLNVDRKLVILKKYSACGSHAVVLPGVTMGEGAVLGACSLARKSLEPWTIYSGIPAIRIKDRKRGLIEKGDLMLKRWGSGA
jgi:galactoside O-acetyltransferase